MKARAVAVARELRAQGVPWKLIPAAVMERVGVKCGAETLRGYVYEADQAQ